MKKIFFSSLFFSLLIFAQEQPPSPTYLGNTGNQNNSEILQDKELSTNVAEIFADKELYKLLDVKIDNYLFAVRELNGLRIATYPKLLFLRNSIPIEVHKEFITKIIFENGKIVKVLSSSGDFKSIQFTDNVLFIQASKRLTACNLEIFLQSGDKRQIVELIITKFNPYSSRDRDKILYTSYYILKPKPLSPYAVLDYFYKIYGYFPKTRKIISIAGIPYEIIPNSKTPNVSIKNIDYLVKSEISIN